MNRIDIGSTRMQSNNSPEDPVVHVIDGDPSVRNVLTLEIRAAGWQAATASCAEEFLDRPPVMAPSCLLVEQNLPGLSAFELQSRLLGRTELPIIFMTGHPDIGSTVRAMKAGAFEFLVKPLGHGVVIKAIADALEQSRAALLHASHGSALRQRYDLLSPREREVMSLVVRGQLNKQVGCELGISEVTVKAHRGKVMRKMQAGSVAELVLMAARVRGAMTYSVKEQPTRASIKRLDRFTSDCR